MVRGSLLVGVLALAFADEPVVPTLSLYDCDAEYSYWETAWTPDWKAWCCLNQQKGCEATFTSTSTSGTKTSTTKTQTSSTRTETSTSTETKTTSTVTITTTLSQTESSTTLSRTRTSTTASSTSTLLPEQECQRNCSQSGVSAKCGDRVQWVSQHVTQNEQNACEAAVVLVVSDCPEVCGLCTAQAAGCELEEVLFVKKFELPGQGQGVLRHFVARSPELAMAGLATLFASVAAFVVVRRRAGHQRALYSDVFLTAEDGLLQPLEAAEPEGL